VQPKMCKGTSGVQVLPRDDSMPQRALELELSAWVCFARLAEPMLSLVLKN